MIRTVPTTSDDERDAARELFIFSVYDTRHAFVGARNVTDPDKWPYLSISYGYASRVASTYTHLAPISSCIAQLRALFDTLTVARSVRAAVGPRLHVLLSEASPRARAFLHAIVHRNTHPSRPPCRAFELQTPLAPPSCPKARSLPQLQRCRFVHARCTCRQVAQPRQHHPAGAA